MKKILAAGLALTMSLSLTACMGGTANSSSAASSGSENSSGSAAASSGTDGVYNIGICQQMQHVSLDEATQGFEDALTELLGEENVKFDYQNAGGEQANCTSIVSKFVTDNVDLIMANATTAVQCAKEPPPRSLWWAPRSPTMCPPALWTLRKIPAATSPGIRTCPMPTTMWN